MREIAALCTPGSLILNLTSTFSSTRKRFKNIRIMLNINNPTARNLGKKDGPMFIILSKGNFEVSQKI